MNVIDPPKKKFYSRCALDTNVLYTDVPPRSGWAEGHFTREGRKNKATALALEHWEHNNRVNAFS